MSYLSRLYNHRNAQTPEGKKEQPFFSKKNSDNKNTKGAFFQAKLTVNEPGDKHEKEADSTADAVVNKKTAAPELQEKNISKIQRLATSAEDEKLGINDARMKHDKDIQRVTAPDKDKGNKIQKLDIPKKEEDKLNAVQRVAAPEKEKEKKIRKMDAPVKDQEGGSSSLKLKTEGNTSAASPQLSSRIENTAGKGSPLPKNTLHEMNASFGKDFSDVNIHNDSAASKMNKELNAHAFTHGKDIYFNSGKYNPENTDGKFLLAHELTHVLQQTGGDEKIQRDLAIEPSDPDVAEPVLTPRKVQEAIIFNNERYGQSSVQLIQDIVGATITGTIDEETIRLIALFQAQNGLNADGLVGINTFNQMTSELAAEGVSQDTCLTMFKVGVVTPMEIHAASTPNTANIFGHFDVEILFSPHCDCSRFEYRQFISGFVTLNGINLNNQFSIPPGNVLPAMGNFIEDGNTNLPNNGRFGHRNSTANQGMLNQYADSAGAIDMGSGCRFRSFDEPGVIGAPANSGDVYVFDFRFFGDIRKDGKMIERKFWSVRETITIP